ncbi:MAG: hypothetical protein IKX14_06355 [Neisseriaceae bacterium]|nr:hypothetical protein [Neisseriaceae bacterium]
MSNQLFPLSYDELRLVRRMQKGFATVQAALSELDRISPNTYWDIWEYFAEATSPHYCADRGENACNELLRKHNQHNKEALKRQKRRRQAA